MPATASTRSSIQTDPASLSSTVWARRAAWVSPQAKGRNTATTSGRTSRTITYFLQTQSDSSQTLYISHGDDTVKVEGWTAGELGITLGAESESATQPSGTGYTITGDFQPIDFDPTKAGVQEHYDDFGNVIVSGEAAPNRADTLYDSAGNDLINAGGGNDTINLGDDNLWTTVDAGGSVTANGGNGGTIWVRTAACRANGSTPRAATTRCSAVCGERPIWADWATRFNPGLARTFELNRFRNHRVSQAYN